MVPLLLHEGYTPAQLLFITPIYFALAHVHHIRNHGNIAEVGTSVCGPQSSAAVH
jgi:hypothetical protein